MEYELTIVLPGKATPAKKKSMREFVEKIVSVLKGKVLSTEDWGEKNLAYKIQKNETGAFLFFVLELNPESVKALDDKIRLEEGIIRYLIVKKD